MAGGRDGGNHEDGGWQGSIWSLWPVPQEERILWALGPRSQGEVGPLTSQPAHLSFVFSAS